LSWATLPFFMVSVMQIVPASVILEKNGKELTTELQNFLGPVRAQFFEQALEIAYMCE
jgi:hypothetical protein